MAPYGGAGFGPYVAFAPPLDAIDDRIRQSDAYIQNARALNPDSVSRVKTRTLKRHNMDAFVSTGKRLQLMERHMSQRLNKDRKVHMQELYDSLYPRREVVVESSFLMSNPVGQKMTCMNVFRHQDLGVLDKAASTTACMTSGDKGWDTPSVPSNKQIGIMPNTTLTQSGYVMRGYGVTLQDTGLNNFCVQSQMAIGPGNHLVGLKNLGDNEYNNLIGNRFNVDTPKYTSVFDGKGNTGANNTDPVRYPNLDQNQVGVSDIMGCLQTLWSPICAQSIEAASANLGFNNLGRGTVSDPKSFLNTSQGDDTSHSNVPFGPLPTDRTPDANPRRVPRDIFDAEGCKFTWNKHTTAYKFTNTYSYPVEVEVIVFKAHGLTSRQGIGEVISDNQTPPTLTQTGQGVTEYYPGLNGPLPWSNTSGGIFNILFGSFNYPSAVASFPNKVQTNNRSMALDFINSWTNHIGRSQNAREGIQLPEVDVAGYPNPAYAIGRFQLNTKPHWPWTNARWRNWHFPKGGSDGSNFLREFSRKKIRIQPSEQVSLDLDLGGFKYSLSDVGYLSKKLEPINVPPEAPDNSTLFKNLTWSTDTDAVPSVVGNPEYHFASKGLMNGSVVVSLTLKGTPCAANAPLLAVGPKFPQRKDVDGHPSGTSITLGDVPPLVDYTDGSLQNPVPLPGPDAIPRGNYATGTVHSAGTLLVECKERVSFQPMMNRRPKFQTNNATKTNHSLLIQPICPVDSVVRTTDSTAVKTYTNTIVANTDADKTANT